MFSVLEIKKLDFWNLFRCQQSILFSQPPHNNSRAPFQNSSCRCEQLRFNDHQCDCLYLYSNESRLLLSRHLYQALLSAKSKYASCSCGDGCTEQLYFCSASRKTSFRQANGVESKVFGSGAFTPRRCRENFVASSRSHQAQTGTSPPGFHFQTFLISLGAKTLVNLVLAEH